MMAQAKLSEMQVLVIREKSQQEGFNLAATARHYGVSANTMSKVVHGQSHKLAGKPAHWRTPFFKGI